MADTPLYPLLLRTDMDPFDMEAPELPPFGLGSFRFARNLVRRLRPICLRRQEERAYMLLPQYPVQLGR